MARQSTSFGRGMLAGVLVMVGALGAHWFITPDALGATAFDRVFTGAQILVGFGGAVWVGLWDRFETRRSAA